MSGKHAYAQFAAVEACALPRASQKSEMSEGNSRKCQGEKDASNARQRHVKCQGNALVHARPFVGAFQVRFWSHFVGIYRPKYKVSEKVSKN